MTDKAIALRPLTGHGMSVYEPQSFDQALALAEMFARSGLVPRAVSNPAALVMIMAQGRELGIGAIRSIRGIHVVDGKPVISAELARELAARAGARVEFPVTTADVCRCRVTSADGRVLDIEWTMQQARDAGLANRGPWKQYPAAMLRARASMDAIRALVPEALGGMYSAEEFGHTIDVGTAETQDSEPRRIGDGASPVPTPQAPPPADETSPEVVQLKTELAASADLGREITALGRRLDELAGTDVAKAMREAEGIVNVKAMTTAQRLVARDALRVLVEGAEADAALGHREPTPDAVGETPWAAPAGQEQR